jgi:hypothetical protein
MYSAYDPNMNMYFAMASNCDTRDDCIESLKELVIERMGIYPESEEELQDLTNDEFLDTVMEVEIRQHDEPLDEDDFSLNLDNMDGLFN